MKKTIFIFLTISCILTVGYAQTVTDIDGNSYNTVIIGTQKWMGENLKTTKYNNGDPIPFVTEDTSWVNLKDGYIPLFDCYNARGHCYYANDSTNKSTYGVLYNWYTVYPSLLCPIGWHVPTMNEWKKLTDFYGGAFVAGSKLKSTILWNSPNTGADNNSGFSALPGGYRSENGGFQNIGNKGYYWTKSPSDEYNMSESAYYANLNYNNTEVEYHLMTESAGFSVRCVNDSTFSSIDEILNKNNIQIYPNPASYNVHIDLINYKNSKLSVFNNLGELVYQCQLTDVSNSVVIDFLQNGIYTFLITNDRHSYTQIVIKE